MESKAPLSFDNTMKVAFSMEGRDKLTKLMQYGSRALAFYVLSADPKSDVGQKLSNLYKTAQTSRKAFRLGKSATYYKKLETLATNKSLTAWQKYLHVIQNTGMFGFFIYDNMVFASKAKIVAFNADDASKRGGVLWFCANIAGLLLALANVQSDLDKEKCVRDILESEDDATRIQALQAELDALQQNRFKKFLAVLKVTCDLIVSSNTSGIRLAERITGSKLHDGIVGSVGCVSALTVLYNAWPNAPKAKETTTTTAAAPLAIEATK